MTEEQLNFLRHNPSQSARVLAGPGTGKSFTSVAYLKKITDDNPELRVGYITFTRAATAEFAKKIDENGLSVKPKTMHGFSLSILMKNHASTIPYPLRILDSWETKNIVRPDIAAKLRANGHDRVTPTKVGELERELAAGFESLDEVTLPIAAAEPELVNAYKGVWRAHRRQYGYILLNELPYHASHVLEDVDESDVNIDLLIVDEYQDLNAAEQKVLLNIANRGIPIIAVGDDDQSIYSWRNAAPEGIRNFLDTFNTTHDYPLTVSMRCGGRALEIASNLIELDSDRQSKPRLTQSERSVDTEFHYLKFRSNTGEAKCVARIVADRIAHGVPANEICILARSSLPAWLNSLKPEFEELNIPIAEATDISAVLARYSTRKSIAMAQILLNRHDAIAWRSLLKVTPGIGNTFIDRIINTGASGNFAQQLLASHHAGLPPGPGTAKAELLINSVLSWLDETSIDNIELDENGWGGWLMTQVGIAQFTDEEKTVLNTVGAQLGNNVHLSKFLVELEPLAKEIVSGLSSGVRIMTMAQSKGLTVNTAIVLGVEDGNIPAPRGEYNEELRLLYVALTRATHMTVITYSNRRKGPTARVGDPRVWIQQEQSQFIRDITGLSFEDGDSYLIA